MIRYKTKYFGQLIINDEDNDDLEIVEEAEVNYIKSNKSYKKYISIILSNINKRNIKLYIKKLNKYNELNVIGKKEIVKRYEQKENMLLFIKDYFDKLNREEEEEIFGTTDFANINIKKYVETIDPPHITILNKDNMLIVYLHYSLLDNDEKSIIIEFNNKLRVKDVKYIYSDID